MLRERNNFLNFESKIPKEDSKISKHQYTPVSNRSDSKWEPTFAIIEDNLRKRIKDIEERTVRASKRGITAKIFDERRMTVFIQTLKDLDESNLISKSLACILIEGFEDTKRRMNTYEKNLQNMNQLLMKQLNDSEAKLRIKESEIQDCTKKFNKNIQKLEKENSIIRDEKLKLMQDIIELKQQIGTQENKANQLLEQIESLKQREIDRLEETDLEDVDLISESTKKRLVSKKPPHPLVPSLDLWKMRKMQEEEFNKLRILKNDLDENIPFQDNIILINSHDEEMEEISSISSKFKEMFFPGKWCGFSIKRSNNEKPRFNGTQSTGYQPTKWNIR